MSTYFPIFVNMEGKNIRVFGGGKIAARRVQTLLAFGANVQVTAPQITKKLEDLARRQGKLMLDYHIYQPGELIKDRQCTGERRNFSGMPPEANSGKCVV